MIIKSLLNREFRGKMVFWLVLWGSVPVLGQYLDTFGEKRKPSWFYSFVMKIVGLHLIGLGIILNAIAGKTLKRYGHFDIRGGISSPDRVVDVGLYSCMRHPAQFGSGLIGLGIGFLRGRLSGVISGMLSFAAAMWFILNVEEPEVMKRFPDYCKKMGEKPAFTLRPFCMLKGILTIVKPVK